MALNLPVDVRALYDAGKRLSQDREKPVKLAVLVESDAPDDLVEAAKDALHPKTAGAMVDVALVEPGYTMKVGSKADATVVVAGSGASLGPTLAVLREHAIPTVVIALREEGGRFSRLIGHPDNDVLVGLEPVELMRGQVADWLMRQIPDKRSALGHNFEFVRRAVAKEAVKATAWQNGAIGVAVFMPGVDMPILTLNQGKMLLQIAAAYGQPLDSERVKELAAVVGGGFLFRTFARELVALLPGLGWAIKGGIAYSGTMAMGMAAIKYFESGFDLGGVVTALTERSGEAARWAASRMRRGGRELLEAEVEEVVPAGDGVAGYTAAAPAQPALLEVPPTRPTLVPPPAEEPPAATAPGAGDGVGAGSLP